MASQENEKAMDGLLRRSLARDVAMKGECPSPELLAAYYQRSLGADEAAGYELHFSECTRCREQLADMARAGAEIEVENPAEPVLVTFGVMKDLAVDAPVQPQASPKAQIRARRWISDLRLLAPAAAAIVLAVFIYVRLAPHHPQNSERQSELAMSKQPPLPTPDQSATPAPASNASNAPSPRASSETTPEFSQLAKKREATSPASTSTPTQQRTGVAGSVSSASAARNGPLSMRAGAVVLDDQRFPTEPAPAAPPPELKGSLPTIAVASDSTEAVSPPAPETSNATSRKSETAGVAGQNFRGAPVSNSLAKVKPAKERSAETVIRTPDSNVLYRIAGGGFIERSQDGGATWQEQLLSPSAEFTAGVAPTPKICWLVGRVGIIFMTEDGKNWTRISLPSNADLVSVEAKDASSAIMTASDGRKWSTDDAGKTWNLAK